ncbi:MAG: 2-oxoacid:acceptor oxidoreductase family protein [Candidatus Aenigmatarchaeota archaeon]
MRKNILIGGKAGQGIDVAASLISNGLSKEGYYIFNYRDYPSLIKGGQNYNIISVSDEKIGSYESKLDILIALDKKTIENHGNKLKDDGILLKLDDFDVNNDYKKVVNVFMTGVLYKTIGLPKERLEKEVKDKFEGKEYLSLDLEAGENGYNEVKTKIELDKSNDDNLKTLTGSEGIAEGSLDAGIDCYFAYPMTPATPILHLLAGRQVDENILVFQPENELGAINMGLGAAHAGAKAMVGTSGGGYDLMQESMSMQGIAEIPLVVYLAQRPGPGSGVPTYSTQGDLDIAVKGGHGEYPRVTLAPGDAKESRRLTNEAFYFAEKFRILSVLLGDKHVAESEYAFEEFEDSLKVQRNIESQKGGEFKNYKITDNGNSPRSVSGLTTVKSTSYEHNEMGITTEEIEMVNKMNDKRSRKTKLLKEEAEKFEMYKVHGNENSDITVVGWGSTKGAILDAIKDLDVKFLQVLYLRPFPEEVKEILEESNNIILVENNSTGLLGNLIAEKTGMIIPEENKILRYDGRPFESDTLREKIEENM